jgi:hypothetical protein
MFALEVALAPALEVIFTVAVTVVKAQAIRHHPADLAQI